MFDLQNDLILTFFSLKNFKCIKFDDYVNDKRILPISEYFKKIKNNYGELENYLDQVDKYLISDGMKINKETNK